MLVASATNSKVGEHNDQKKPQIGLRDKIEKNRQQNSMEQIKKIVIIEKFKSINRKKSQGYYKQK